LSRRTKKSRTPSIYHGVLLVDKPTGMSSFDVIRQVRKKLGIRKIGHTGTLDPMASGVLVLCLGDATKLVQYLTADDKTYRGEVTLGEATDSYDADGETTALNLWEELATIQTKDIQQACHVLQGDIQQVPPMYSAIKVDGERLYAKARRGEIVEVKPRHVHIYKLNSYDWIWHAERARIQFMIDATCSKGTYIRSLAVDIAGHLKVHGHLSALRRTASGRFSIDQCYQLDDIDTTQINTQLLSIKEALTDWPTLIVTPQQAQKITYGQKLDLKNCPSIDIHDADLVCACNQASQVLAILQKESDQFLRVVKGFHLSINL
jgi:tRNA pseudouridine55 synthase